MHDDDPGAVSFSEIRRTIGDANSQSLISQGGRFRRKLRLAFDAMVFQYCANERVEWQDSRVEEGPWEEVVQRFLKTIPGPVPQSSHDDPAELKELLIKAFGFAEVAA